MLIFLFIQKRSSLVTWYVSTVQLSLLYSLPSYRRTIGNAKVQRLRSSNWDLITSEDVYVLQFAGQFTLYISILSNLPPSAIRLGILWSNYCMLQCLQNNRFMLSPLCHYAQTMLTQSFLILQSQLLFITFSCHNIAWNIDCVNDLLKISNHTQTELCTFSYSRIIICE